MSCPHLKTVTVSSKGWVVIPASLRKKINLKPGMKMNAEEVGGKIVLTPQSEDPVLSLYGKLAGGGSLTRALIEERSRDKNSEETKICS
jgi:AbrB family looped-hinge helix DNA binding protein